MGYGHPLTSMKPTPASPLLPPASILLALPRQLPLPLAKQGGNRLTSNTGENQNTPNPMPDPIMEIFYDLPDTPDESTPDDDIFHATSSHTSDTDGLYYFDPSDIEHGNTFMGHAFHLTMEPQDAIDSHDVNIFLFTLDYDELRGGS